VSDLADFLLARIAEDERIARDADPSPWTARKATSSTLVGSALVLGIVAATDAVHGEYLLRYQPSRVLAECESKRRLVQQLDDGDLLRLMVPPYADHPDCREEWRP
jgi:hypothetical protein